MMAVEAPLEVLLTDAAPSGRPRWTAPGPAVRLAVGLARRPRRVAGRAAGLAAELGRVAAGRPEVEPDVRDKRWKDPAWEGNWLLRRVLGAYLAVGSASDGLICDAELDWRAERQARFLVGNVLDALAPTNSPVLNPTVLKATVDRGGANFVAGARQLVGDLGRPPHLPASVDPSGFEVGGNLAATPGAVVLREEAFELMQYTPSTPTVHAVPLLVVPPSINKYYVLDLAPGRSIIEYLVGAGLTVFTLSWRNPTAEHAKLDFDAYAAAILRARETAAAIAGSDSVHLAAACSGGLLSAGVLGHLADRGRLGEVASLSLLVAALDNAQAGTPGALTSPDIAAAAAAESARRGYLDGRALAGVFAWLRPNDLVWSYFVNNYLLGRAPPAFDVLYWNGDTVRLAAGLHRDFLTLALENGLAQPGGTTVLGSPVDLGAVDVDAYAVAGLTDHLVPWANVLRGARLLGGRTRFVLSTSGHIQALVNPPGPESKRRFRVSDELAEDPEAWKEGTPEQRGSWWDDWVEWLRARSGEERPAPPELGGEDHPPLEPAPGTYVHGS